MKTVENTTIDKLIFDDKNANKHSEKGLRILEKSISKLGLGRSILLDKNNNIIAGNGVTETCGQLGINGVKIIETDGNEIIAVKRMDIDLDSKKGRELAITDNHVAKESINFDRQVLVSLENDYKLDLDYYELDTDSILADAYNYEQKAYDEDKIPYPITIVVNKEDYELWLQVKEKINCENDKKAFFKILKESYL